MLVPNSEEEWIWICFHKGCLLLEGIKFAVSSSPEPEVSVEAELIASTRDEWVRVPYRDFHKKNTQYCLAASDGDFT